jgi:hypothetical protein
MMARHLTMLESYRLSGPVSDAEDALTAMGERIDGVEALLNEGSPTGLLEEVSALRATLERLGDELDDASDGASQWGRIQGVSGPPTADAVWLIERSYDTVPEIIRRINAAASGALQAILRQVYASAAMPAPLDPVPLPRRGG